MRIDDLFAVLRVTAPLVWDQFWTWADPKVFGFAPAPLVAEDAVTALVTHVEMGYKDTEAFRYWNSKSGDDSMTGGAPDVVQGNARILEGHVSTVVAVDDVGTADVVDVVDVVCIGSAVEAHEWAANMA